MLLNNNLLFKSIISFAFLGTKVFANECEQIQNFLISSNYTLDTVTDCVEDQNGLVTSL